VQVAGRGGGDLRLVVKVPLAAPADYVVEVRQDGSSGLPAFRVVP
jgi:hypothetical protein